MNNTSENIRAVRSRLVCYPTAAIWFLLLKLLYVNSIMKMIYIGYKTRRKVGDDFRRAEACVGWWITPVKKWLYAIRASARTFNGAYNFHNENQMIETEFTRRAVGTRDNSLSLFHWSFWIAASPLRRWDSSHTLLLVIQMSSYLVGASNTFLLGIIRIPNPRWGDEMVPSVWSTERVFEARWYFTGGISRLKYHFHNEKEWLVNELELARVPTVR